MRESLPFAIILCLIVLGGSLALYSGETQTRVGHRLHVLGGNLSAMILRFAAFVAGVLAVQRVIGTPSLLDW